MKVANIFAVIVIIKLHTRVLFRNIFSLNMNIFDINNEN